MTGSSELHSATLFFVARSIMLTVERFTGFSGVLGFSAKAFRTTLLALVVLLGAAAGANAADAGAVAKAKAYVDPADTGKVILNYVHMGSRYGGHNFVETRNVQDGQARILAGYFALIYRFNWENDGATDVAFLCTPAGKIYDIQTTWTNAVLNQPYLTANLTIQVLGNARMELFKNNMQEDERRELQQLINGADARGLLVWVVKMTQP